MGGGKLPHRLEAAVPVGEGAADGGGVVLLDEVDALAEVQLGVDPGALRRFPG